MHTEYTSQNMPAPVTAADAFDALELGPTRPKPEVVEGVEYAGAERLYIVDDGETYCYVAASDADARAKHLAEVIGWIGAPEDDPAEWEITELAAGSVHRVGGDVSEGEVPAGGSWDPDTRYPGSGRTVGTAAQYAAHHAGASFAIWSSVY